jgi:lipopolysaccharide/colanic/teichoic acid biosynthesis glycosyltransferase
MKRAFDVIVASVMLCLALPLFLLSAIAVRLTSKGPVLFEQQRWGRNGVLFRCLKFRTMVVDAEDWLLSDPDLQVMHKKNGFKLGSHQDPRVTELGQVLRKTYLDELPQLVNVILGDMSLVGPRPIVEEELEWYGDDKAEYLSVRPGVFGAWTAQGRQRVEYPARASVELSYVRDATILRDAQVLLRHIPVLMVGLTQGLRFGCMIMHKRLSTLMLLNKHERECDRVI